MYILVDESQRIFADPFDAICKSVRENDQICIFSSDPEQMLTETEIRNDIVAKINALPPEETFVLLSVTEPPESCAVRSLLKNA